MTLIELKITRPKIRIGGGSYTITSPELNDSVLINPEMIVSMTSLSNDIECDRLAHVQECTIKLSNGDQYITGLKSAQDFYSNIMRNK